MLGAGEEDSQVAGVQASFRQQRALEEGQCCWCCALVVFDLRHQPFCGGGGVAGAALLFVFDLRRRRNSMITARQRLPAMKTIMLHFRWIVVFKFDDVLLIVLHFSFCFTSIFVLVACVSFCFIWGL